MRFELVALAAVVAACEPETVPRPERPPANYASLTDQPSQGSGALVATARERGIAAAYLAALSDPAFTGLDALLDEDAHFVVSGNEHDAHGRSDILAAHKGAFDALASRTFAAHRVLLTDRTQSIEWTLTGTGKNGKKVGVDGVALAVTKDDGTVSDLQLYFDEGIMRAQLGVIQQPQLAALAMPVMPTGSATVVEQAHGSDEARNGQIVSDWLDPGLEKDEGRYAAAMTDDVVFETREAPPLRGKPAAIAGFDRWHQAIGNLDVQVLPPLLVAGNFVEVEYRLVGAMRGRVAFVPPLGGLITLYDVAVVEMRGGKIAHVWRYDNPAQILPDASSASTRGKP
jgi:ketosteroid isomerase-like protein